MLALLFAGTVSSQAWAATWTVQQDGLADFVSITDALWTAGPGDTVEVASGTYGPSTGEAFPLHPSTGINLIGAGPDLTILDSEGGGSIMEIEANDVAFEGLAFTGAADGPAVSIGYEIERATFDTVRFQVDEDCSGADLTDADGDGHDADHQGGDDCDDTDESIHPGAWDLPDNGIDEDCSGADAHDTDGDGWPDEQDCAPEDPSRYPTAAEACDGIDNDCDDQVDEGCEEGDSGGDGDSGLGSGSDTSVGGRRRARDPDRCGCASASAGGGWWVVGALLAVARRRRSRVTRHTGAGSDHS